MPPSWFVDLGSLHHEKGHPNFLTVEKMTIACGEAQVGQYRES